MTLNSSQLDLRIAGCALALSARRIWEHTEYGQINPFAPLSTSGAIQPEAYVDIVNMSGAVQMLTGLTLEDALAGQQTGVVRALVKQLLQHVGSASVRNWLANVQHHLFEFIQKSAQRDMPQAFLLPDNTSPLGVRGLHSALKSRLRAHRSEKASVNQWRERINSLEQQGLHTDELAFCGLDENLPDEPDRIVDGDAISDCVRFDALRLSILPVVRPAHARLEFVRIPANASIKRVKPKLKSSLQTRPQWRDRVLGYWIDIVELSDLLGSTRGWMAFTPRGEPVVTRNNPSGLCTSLEEAKLLANRHAEKTFAELPPRGEGADIRPAGGADYREWLVTLPYYPPSYFSSHFEHRNVLLHVRCDIREGTEGERVLLLQEIQSDWAQQARRDRREEDTSSTPIPVPPWLQEWPALAMKLILLHAAQCGAHAVAWVMGDIQTRPHGVLARAELMELYDRTLPAEVSQLLRRYGRQCERVALFQPAYFYIEPADAGYAVLDQQGEHLGSAVNWEEARAIIPHGSHEVLTPMHGVVLDESLKRAILADGFCAWGMGCDH